MIDHPAFKPEQLGNFAIAIATILFGEPDQGQAQRIIIVSLAGFVLLRGARHADRSAGAPLRGIELLTHVDHGLTQVSWLQALGFR